jgi:hypothetical protein
MDVSKNFSIFNVEMQTSKSRLKYQIIEADGNSVQPVTVGSLQIFPGMPSPSLTGVLY